MAGAPQNRRASDMGSAESALQIGLVPLIDLSLTLVVVFLIFMPMAMTSLIPISSGEGGSGRRGTADPAPEAPILMEITPAAVKIGQASFTTELSMTAWLRDAAAQRNELGMTVKVLPEVSQERLVQVLDWIRSTADWKVRLLTISDSRGSE